MNHYLKTSLSFLLILILVACNGHEKQPVGLKKYEVKAEPLHKTLHFTGTIQPLRENTLSSPMEAVVQSMNVHYGQMVKKGELILTLNSMELQKQYNDTLTDYLKAKDSYTVAKAKFIGTQELWDAGLLSKNNYLSEKSSLDNARVTLMQASRKLTELLEKMNEHKTHNLSSLSLADFDRVSELLTSKHNIIQLFAPCDGVMLYPPKTGEDKATRISTGSTVKSGQVIALVGDLTGVSVEIDIPEIDISQVRPGMTATISGVAFGKHQLKGSLVSVNAQALNTSAGGLPSFTAIVEVNSLTQEELSWIKVGMSAAIELNVDSENQLLIPIAAIKREQGNSIVRLQLAQGTIEKRIIKTGPALADSVVVETGVKAGDVVLYD